MKAIFKREEEDLTCIVGCKDNTKINTRNLFIFALTDSITKWVNTTNNGMKAYEYSCGDFNIGDLSSHLSDEKLIEILKANGIVDLSIEFVDDFQFSFDRILVNPSEIHNQK